ncbi:MAG: zinc-binding dehydrogenase [Vulcanimicrobiaceae bacterium]
MRAIVTSPDIPGKVKAVEAPAPSAGPETAVVRVAASSLNRGELRLIPARPNGWAPGQDLAGTVEVPASAGGPPAGARVVGLADGGAWSELVAVPIARLSVLPDAVDFTTAAALPAAGLTALRALRALGDVVGRSLLVTGAGGGAGNLAAQLAVAAGAVVTGLVRHSLALEGVRIVGALGDDERFERIIDSVGGDVLSDVLRHLQPDAKLVFFGIVADTPSSFDLSTFGGSPRATVQPIFVYDAPGRFDEDLVTLAAFVAAGRLKPLVAQTFPRAHINNALDALKAGGVEGKIVIAE